MKVAAAPSFFAGPRRHQLRPAAGGCRSARLQAQPHFARADWQAACAILASNSSTGGGGSTSPDDASNSKQPASRVNGQKPLPPPAPALEKAPAPAELDLVPVSNLPRPLSICDLSPAPMHGSQLRVAYQGVPGAYSEAAAAKAYPGCDAIPCDQFEVAFQAVELWIAGAGSKGGSSSSILLRTEVAGRRQRRLRPASAAQGAEKATAECAASMRSSARCRGAGGGVRKKGSSAMAMALWVLGILLFFFLGILWGDRRGPLGESGVVAGHRCNWN